VEAQPADRRANRRGIITAVSGVTWPLVGSLHGAASVAKVWLVALAVLLTLGCTHRRHPGALMSPAPPLRYSDSTRTDDMRRAEQALDVPHRQPQDSQRAKRREPSEASPSATDLVAAVPKPVGSTWSVVTTPTPSATPGQTTAPDATAQNAPRSADAGNGRRGVRPLDIVLGSIGLACAALALRKRARELA
jgi:hypothetical protein